MLYINGEERQDWVGLTVSAYLARAGYDPVRVAVEKNEQIVPKRDYDACILEEDDQVEIVHFVGGG